MKQYLSYLSKIKKIILYASLIFNWCQGIKAWTKNMRIRDCVKGETNTGSWEEGKGLTKRGSGECGGGGVGVTELGLS